MSDPSPHIRLKNVSRIYETKSERVVALKDVSLQIDKGERIALLGRSGSGKSTLLNLLGGLDRVSSGSILVDDKDLADLDSDGLAQYRLGSVGIVFQAFNLIRTKTALQNIEVPFALARKPRSERRDKAIEALKSVGLEDRSSHQPSELSGGEQQRVAVARALVNQPALLLADEPTGNLDSGTAADIMQMLADYSDKHQTTVVLVTHDEELATSFANRTLRLRDGQLSNA